MRRGAKTVSWSGRLIAMFALLICTGARGQGIFDFDEPPATPSTTTRPSPGAGPATSAPQPPAIDLRPGPRPAPPDRFYLFPPISWEDATRGVIHLATPPPVAPGAANKQVPVAPDLGEVPPIRPASIAALRRRYAELISDQQVRDIEAVYGEDERRAAGKPAELMVLVGTLKAAAKDVTDQPVMQRYLLLRAFEV